MKMKLKDHKEIGKVVLDVRDDIRQCCVLLSNMAFDASSQVDRDFYTARFKGYSLILTALEHLIREYDFDCVIDRYDNKEFKNEK